MIRLTALLVLLAPLVAHADVAGEAQALFDQGVADLEAGRTAQACEELQASLAKLQDSGTKGALATCDGKLGKIATAWQLWKELADTAPTPELRASAAQNAAALEPRLPRYIVRAPAIRGLAVTVDGSAVDLAVAVPLPVDPGTLAVTAKAPGYRPWSGTAQAAEGQVTTIVIPPLVALPPPPAPPAAMVTVVDDHARHARRELAVGVAIGGGALVATSLVFGGIASSKLATAKADCGGDLNNCPGAQFARARSAYDSANASATASTVLFAVGGAAIAGAIVAWFTAPAAETREQPRAAWHVVPTADPHGAGVTILGGW